MTTSIDRLTLVFDVHREFEGHSDVTVVVDNPDPDSPLMVAAMAAWMEDYQKRLDAMRASGEQSLGMV